jgi:hypothetical protein
MPQISIDENARDLLRLWRKLYGKASGGAVMDYSEAIRTAHKAVIASLRRQEWFAKGDTLSTEEGL